MKGDILQPEEHLPSYLTHFKDVVEAAERQQSRQQKQGGKKRVTHKKPNTYQLSFPQEINIINATINSPPLGRLAISTRISIKHMFAFNTT